MPTNDERENVPGKFSKCMLCNLVTIMIDAVPWIDVLTDLMHLAARAPELGLEFDSSLKMAQFHFEAEAEGMPRSRRAESRGGNPIHTEMLSTLIF